MALEASADLSIFPHRPGSGSCRPPVACAVSPSLRRGTSASSTGHPSAIQSRRCTSHGACCPEGHLLIGIRPVCHGSAISSRVRLHSERHHQPRARAHLFGNGLDRERATGNRHQRAVQLQPAPVTGRSSVARRPLASGPAPAAWANRAQTAARDSLPPHPGRTRPNRCVSGSRTAE